MSQKVMTHFQCDECGTKTDLPGAVSEKIPAGWVYIETSVGGDVDRYASRKNALCCSKTCAGKWANR